MAKKPVKTKSKSAKKQSPEESASAPKKKPKYNWNKKLANKPGYNARGQKKRNFKGPRQPSALEGIPRRADLPEEERARLRQGFLEGNQEWRQRSKHGRDKLFADPQLMLEAALEYFKWCDENPWLKHDYKGGGKNLKEVYMKLGRPYTVSGAAMYMGATERYFYEFKSRLKTSDPMYDDFLVVINTIEEIVRRQKYQGAAVGAFNANLISYDLGIRKDQQINGGPTGVNIIVQSDKSSDLLEEVKAKLEALDKEEES